MQYLLIASVLVMLASLVGVMFVWRGAGKFIERNLSLLVSFSAGVFAMIAYELAFEAVEHSVVPIAGIIWVFAGAIIFWVIFKIIPSFHHHHGGEDCEKCSNSDIDARRVLVGDALHNIGDGIFLAASFVVSPGLGFITAVSVFVHELVQEVSEFFVLRRAGYSIARALALNFAVSTTILVGALGGFFLMDIFEAAEVSILGLASGAFIVVVLHDLIPHSVRVSRKKGTYFPHIAWFVGGIALMIFLNLLTGH